MKLDFAALTDRDRDGEFTERELRDLLNRDDVIAAPHDTYYMSSGADLPHIPLERMPRKNGNICEILPQLYAA